MSTTGVTSGSRAPLWEMLECLEGDELERARTIIFSSVNDDNPIALFLRREFFKEPLDAKKESVVYSTSDESTPKKRRKK